MDPETSNAADNSRRKWLKSACLLPTLLLISEQSQAGGQIEEPLADAVRIAMRNAVHSSDPPIPEFKDTPSYIQYLRWLGEMSERLKPKNATFKRAKNFCKPFGTKANVLGWTRLWCWV